MNILLTSTSFQDTPGVHQEKLKNTGFAVDKLRGPLKREVLLPIIANYDGIICGDDEITEEVIKTGVEGNLKIISKYGIGLDKVDLEAANKYNVPVTNCLGVNHITVAEHVFALLLAYYKNIHLEYNITKEGGWKRLIGNEIFGKSIGIVGFGKIGKEVALRAKGFGLNVLIYDPFVDNEFIKNHDLYKKDTIIELFIDSDIVSLNLPLTDSSRGLVSQEVLSYAKNGVVIVNTSRALIIEQDALYEALENKKIKAYLTDVLEEEPMVKDHPLLKYDNVIITPHIGSRTYESVQRQGSMAVDNLLIELKKFN